MEVVQIFPPGASQLASAWASTIQLGSWIMADPGPDYGAKGLIESVQAQNALRDGGTFAYRRGVIRKMAIPLMINTPSPVMWESSLRKAVTLGAIVSVQPEGVPSAQAVYFDIIDGRWEPDYNIFHNRVGVRKGTLYLDTQPWGYWPTEILLASSASVGYIGQLAVNGASVIGDVPPLAHISVMPTVASSYVTGGNVGTLMPDMAALSLGGRPSFVSFIPAGSWIGESPAALAGTATLTGDKYAPASQAWQWTGTTVLGGLANSSWQRMANLTIPSALEPAYRGRFRVFALYKFGASNLATAGPWSAILDADKFIGAGSMFMPLASANQLASVYPYLVPLSGPGGILYAPTSFYSMFDQGEITLPAVGSGIQGGTRLRLWMNPGYNSGTYFPFSLFFGGVILLPVDDAAGVLTEGMIIPSRGGLGNVEGVGSQGGFEVNSGFVDSQYIISQSPQPPVSFPVRNARANYRGVPLRLGASTNQLIVLTGDKQVLTSNSSGTYTSAAIAQANLEYAQVSVSYRPTFQFLAGL